MLNRDFFVVGLTGGLASGKSLVSQLFSEKGVKILDADMIVRDLHQKPDIQHSIAQKFGKIHRQALRELVFRDVGAKQWLEQLIQPLVLDEIFRWQLPPSSPYGILVAPLLIETGLYQHIDQVLVVDCDQPLQILRAKERDQISQDLAMSIVEQQASREQRLQKADHIIVNNGPKHHLDSQVEQLHQTYLQLAKKI